ncbi:MAG: lactonase family protein [Vulcanimicrobiota bacterium]
MLAKCWLSILLLLCLTACGGGGASSGGTPSAGPGPRDSTLGRLSLQVTLPATPRVLAQASGSIASLAFDVTDTSQQNPLVGQTLVTIDPDLSQQVVTIDNLPPGPIFLILSALNTSGQRVFLDRVGVEVLAGQTSSASFDLTMPSHLSLAFLSLPNASVGRVIDPVQVQLQDQNGLPVAYPPVDVTLTLASSSPSANLGGTVTRTTNGGVATFTDLLLDTAGSGFVYTASSDGIPSSDSSTFPVFSGLASGALVPITTVPTGITPNLSALSPDGRFLYVPNFTSADISVFATNNGNLAEISGSPFASITTGPGSVTISPNGQTAYVAGDMLATFSIASDGSLTPLGSPIATGGLNSLGSALHPFLSVLYTANFGSSDVSSFSLAANGAPTPLAVVPSGGQTVELAFNAAGDRLYTSGGQAFSVAANGALTPVSGPSIPVAPGVNSIALTPNGQFAYISTRSTTILGFSLDANGALQPLPGSPFASQGTFVNGVGISADGQFLYVLNKDGSNSVSVFSIDGAGGLTAISGSPFLSGGPPRQTVADPTGKFVYVPNIDNATVTSFAVVP